MFRSTRIKLAILYTIIIALVMAVFSVFLYLAIAASFSTGIEVPENFTQHAENVIIQGRLANARWTLVIVNATGWVVAAATSYFVAGAFLRPIEAAFEQQRQFTSHASHELRTPLTVMKGEIDVTLARERSNEEYRETLHRVDAEVLHLEQMADYLLALAQLQSTHNRLTRESRSVGEAVQALIPSWAGPAAERKVRLKCDIPADLEAALDWPRITQLLNNLLSNAIRHTPEGGYVLTKAFRAPRRLELQVYNSGPGIPNEEMRYVFLPFYRGRHSQQDEGSGLGLALCDWISRAHGGSIKAENTSDGVLFSVTLPDE